MTRTDASSRRRPSHEPGPPIRLRVPGGVLRVARRTLVVGIALSAATLMLAIVMLGLGDYPLTVPEVLAALVGDQGFDSTVVRDWRLPRVLAAIVFGAALAVSGGIFQTLTRNPLGSPDIIGFSAGAYTGAIVAITLVGQVPFGTATGALLGGLLTALVVYLLAFRRGGVQGFRLIVVGIGITAMLSALNTYLLLRADTEVAMAAAVWGAGSLSLVGWDQVWPAFALLVPLGVASGLLARPLRQLELGDDAARAHGLEIERARLLVVFVGVALIAVVTAVCGPIAFVALAAPQIAQRIARSAGIPLGVAAATGAFLLLAADGIAQFLVPVLLPATGAAGTVPVGVVTVVIGGIYLVYLLIREARRM